MIYRRAMTATYSRLCCLIFGVFCQASISSAQQRPFTVHDGVEMAYFGNIFDSSPEKSYDDGAVSPDGRFAIKITHRGVLPDGVTEGTIWLFDVSDVLKSIEQKEATPPPPVPLARMSGAINGYSTDFRHRGNILLERLASGVQVPTTLILVLASDEDLGDENIPALAGALLKLLVSAGDKQRSLNLG